MGVLTVFDHYKPSLEGLSVTHCAGGHAACGGFIYFLDQHGPVSEMGVLLLRLYCAWRSIDRMHLLSTLALLRGDGSTAGVLEVRPISGGKGDSGFCINGGRHAARRGGHRLMPEQQDQTKCQRRGKLVHVRDLLVEMPLPGGNGSISKPKACAMTEGL